MSGSSSMRKKKEKELEENQKFMEKITEQYENKNKGMQMFVRGGVLKSQGSDRVALETKDSHVGEEYKMDIEPYLKKEREEKVEPVSSKKRGSNMKDFMEEMKRAKNYKRNGHERSHSSSSSRQSRSSSSVPRKESSEKKVEKNSMILVSGLSSRLDESKILSTFGKYGNIQTYRILNSRLNKNMSRIALISYYNPYDAERAKNDMSRQSLKGEPVTVANSSVITHILPEYGYGEKGCVIVTLPIEGRIKQLIDKTALYVFENGMAFEKLLLEKHTNNDSFSFLNEVGSPLNTYYRWKVISLTQGDNLDEWRTKPFQLLLNGPIWIPPPTDDNEKKASISIKLSKYSGENLDRNLKSELEDILTNLTIDRNDILMAMGFVLDQSEFAAEIVEIISLAIMNSESPKMKLALLFLISDVLYNCLAVNYGYIYREALALVLEEIFSSLKKSYNSLTGRITKKHMRESILKVIRVWEQWSVFPTNVLLTFRVAFIEKKPEKIETVKQMPSEKEEPIIEDIDGEDLTDIEYRQIIHQIRWERNKHNI